MNSIVVRLSRVIGGLGRATFGVPHTELFRNLCPRGASNAPVARGRGSGHAGSRGRAWWSRVRDRLASARGEVRSLAAASSALSATLASFAVLEADPSAPRWVTGAVLGRGAGHREGEGSSVLGLVASRPSASSDPVHARFFTRYRINQTGWYLVSDAVPRQGTWLVPGI